MVQLSATRCSSIAVLWVNLVSFAAITLWVASQGVFIVVSVYFVMDSVRKLLDTPPPPHLTEVRMPSLWELGCCSWRCFTSSVNTDNGLVRVVRSENIKWTHNRMSCLPVHIFRHPFSTHETAYRFQWNLILGVYTESSRIGLNSMHGYKLHSRLHKEPKLKVRKFFEEKTTYEKLVHYIKYRTHYDLPVLHEIFFWYAEYLTQ